MIVGIVLAGGLGTRMGGADKALLPLGGRPMLAHCLQRLAPQVDRIAISANGEPARLAGFGLPVLADSVPGYPGPLAGVLAAMDWAASAGAGGVVSLAADTPFAPADLAARLTPAGFAMAASPDAQGRMRRHPTVALWPVALRDDLRRALAEGEHKVGRWATEHGAQTVVWSERPDPFFNVNTPADLAEAEARL
ncbi:MAG: molybdenum cofactor guanylyltransferase MobA [Rhodobacter sp.]|nr:molybdenum cofactor guanylyltransferase MobA [Paracoccaceae bacterium]MCC0080638.1 molybdenum cofactor guanylyltransferase MobA [Rhodobacter sp.]